MGSRTWLYQKILREYEGRGLSEDDWSYLKTYARASVFHNTESIYSLTNNKHLARKLTKEFSDDWKRIGRDMMIKWTKGVTEVDPNIGAWEGLFNREIGTCGRCLAVYDECTCPISIKTQAYGPDDWRRDILESGGPEESIIKYLDTHIKAFDLLPYGNGVLGLSKGKSVRLALPNHILQDMIGSILEYRSSDRKYHIIVFRGNNSYNLYVNPNEIIVTEKKNVSK